MDAILVRLIFVSAKRRRTLYRLPAVWGVAKIIDVLSPPLAFASLDKSRNRVELDGPS